MLNYSDAVGITLFLCWSLLALNVFCLLCSLWLRLDFRTVSEDAASWEVGSSFSVCVRACLYPPFPSLFLFLSVFLSCSLYLSLPFSFASGCIILLFFGIVSSCSSSSFIPSLYSLSLEQQAHITHLEQRVSQLSTESSDRQQLLASVQADKETISR